MKTNEVTEGNKLILEFNGYGFISDSFDGKIQIWKDGYYFNPKYDESPIVLKEAKYHYDWNWLMPIVEEIENLGYSITIGTSYRKDKSKRTYCEIGTPEMWNFELTLKDSPEPIIELDEKNGNSKITNVWLACIEFIKWYNANFTKP